MRINLSGAAFILIVLTAFAHAQQVPRWARNLPDLPPMPLFYQGVGSANQTDDVDADWQKASGQARAQILQQIRVVVINNVTAKIEEKLSVKEASVTEAFSATTDQITAGSLENLVVERWYNEDQKKLYAYAHISRAEVEAKFEERLQSAVASARVFTDAATKAINNGNAFLALASYIDAMKVVTLAEVYLNKTLYGDVQNSGKKTPLLPSLESSVCGLLSKFKFLMTGGNDQLAERGRALQSPLTGRLMFESTPVKNASLSVTFIGPAKGQLSAISNTDEEGRFRISVNEITSGEAVNKIRVSPGVSGFDVLAERSPSAGRCLSDTYADFTFKLKTRANVTVAMHIVEYNLTKKRAKSSVQEEIQKKLLGDRYAIVEESKMMRLVSDEKLTSAIRSGNFQPVISALSKTADIVVVGLVTTEQRTNPAAGIYFSNGTAVIRAIDAKNGQILASVSLDNEKEGGGSYEIAGVRLLQRLGKKIGEELKTNIDEALK